MCKRGDNGLRTQRQEFARRLIGGSSVRAGRSRRHVVEAARLTVAVLMLDIETEWTLNALLTTSSSYRKCSKRQTLDHSAQAISLLQIEGTTRR